MVDYDVIVIGSGPAGMNACLYASRSNLKTLVIEKQYPGGKIVSINKIENWLGEQTIDGADLALKMFKHAFSYGATYEQNNVLDIIDYGNYKEVILSEKKYKCYAVIICIGVSERKIGIPGEDKYYGKGVSYCAVCDALLYKNKNMVVVGDSDYALEEALYLSKFASSLIIANNKDILHVNESLLSKINLCDNIKIINSCTLESINGDENGVTSVTIDGKKIETSVVFPLVGKMVDSRFVTRLKIVDDKNYIKVDEKQQTSVSGIYAAGDCTNRSLKQIVTASSDGAIAAIEAYKYINKIKKES